MTLTDLSTNISFVVAIFTLLIWLWKVTTAIKRSFRARHIKTGVYFASWVDPVKQEINVSVARLKRAYGSLKINVLYAHSANHDYKIKLKPYAKHEDILSGNWESSGGSRLYKGPVLFRHEGSLLKGRWLGPKSNMEINGGLFHIKKIDANSNEYISYKTKPLRYWLSQIKLPTKSIVKDIIEKHEKVKSTQKYEYKDLTFDIPPNTFNPSLGKVSERLLNYAKSVTPRDSIVLDIGTGCGVYAITLASQMGCNVVGLDIDQKEINVANTNANKNGVRDKTSFKLVNEKSPFEPVKGSEKFDIIIANLPFSRTSKVFWSLRHPMCQCFYGKRWLLEKLIMGSAYHINLKGKLLFAYADSGYKKFLEDLISVSPWEVRHHESISTKDDTFHIYDLRLKDEFKELLESENGKPSKLLKRPSLSLAA